MANQETAMTILSQLGGASRISAMIGAKHFMSTPTGVRFKWSARAKNKANYISITHNGNDLYDIEFGYCRGMTYAKRSAHTDVYAEDLIPLFERETELYLHF